MEDVLLFSYSLIYDGGEKFLQSFKMIIHVHFNRITLSHLSMLHGHQIGHVIKSTHG